MHLSIFATIKGVTWRDKKQYEEFGRIRITTKANMGRNLMGVIYLAVILLTIVVEKSEAVDCSSAGRSLVSCAFYVMGFGLRPSSSCCSATKSMEQQLQSLSHDDRVSYCDCFKNYLAKYNVDTNHLANLPSKCGVELGYTLSSTMSCNQWVLFMYYIYLSIHYSCLYVRKNSHVTHGNTPYS